mgnify:CR=1 FL=1
MRGAEQVGATEMDLGRPGVVWLDAVVMPDGTVGSVRVTRPLDPDLDQSAVASFQAVEPGRDESSQGIRDGQGGQIANRGVGAIPLDQASVGQDRGEARNGQRCHAHAVEAASELTQVVATRGGIDLTRGVTDRRPRGPARRPG